LENHIKAPDNQYLTGIFAVLAALSYWIIGATHFLMPKAQLHFATGIKADFFKSLASESTAFQVHYWVFAVSSLLVMVVVLGLKDILKTRRSLWLRFTEVLAVTGLALTAIDFVLMQNYALRLAKEFANLDAAAQTVISTIGLPHLDPQGLFGFGFTGLWLGTVNLIMIRARQIPKWLAISGLLGAFLNEGVFLGTLFHQPVLIDLAVGIGGIIVGPIWLIWLGIRLIRHDL
jgi:hypothetical protein